MTNRSDSKTAEKEYLRRSGGSAWEREKPFAPEGTDSFAEGLELLSDYVVAARLLQPSPDDRILDLGAGGGWCSHLLQRMSRRRSFPVDISLDMLRIARARGTNPTVGDLERLPFRDGSFDKAICVSALHHVPSMRDAIREVYRVLTDTGVVVFSEPGVGHSDRPWSVAAIQDFGVLEQEVHIEPTIEMCREAGFTDVHVCPVSYVIPEFTLTDDEWRQWARLAESKRPVRAAEKIWRGVLELFGMGKGDVLFEEAFAMRLVRLLRIPAQEHPFIVAAKTDLALTRRPTYRAALAVGPLPETLTSGAVQAIAVTVTNHGADTWRGQSGSLTGRVQVGLQLLDAEQRLIDRDFGRLPLPEDVPPGGALTIRGSFDAPSAPGQYSLKVDMVSEGRTWFEPTGSPVQTVRFGVRSA